MATATDLVCDIETDDSKRIYGDMWYQRMAEARCTLANSSGANVFDLDGHLKEKINAYKEQFPSSTDRELYEAVIKEYDNTVKMNQISPKFFEAMCFRTVLILFKDRYDEAFKENVHYIPLEKDFSNFDEVYRKIKDPTLLKDIADNCLRDIVNSQHFSYKNFIEEKLNRTLLSSILYSNFPAAAPVSHRFQVDEWPVFAERTETLEKPMVLTFQKAITVLKTLLFSSAYLQFSAMWTVRMVSKMFGRLTNKDPQYLYNCIRSIYRKAVGRL
jgi:hypothetical protein